MAATRALQKFYAAANELYFYTPDRGYTYHSTTSNSKSKSSNLLESTRTSRANSPIPDTASQTSVQPTSTGTKETQNQGNDDRAIATSFQLAVRWGNEYMDENPLIGEPGALKLSSTSRQLKDQQDKNQAAEASKTAQKEKEKEAESTRASVAATPTPAPPAIKTDLKKSSMSKGKSPISAVSDGGVKKAGRRKSMKPGTPGVGSPGS
jgi:mediator of RNA polymerase II transcription subunit 6